MKSALIVMTLLCACGSGTSGDPLVGSWKVVWPSGSSHANDTDVYTFNADHTLAIDEQSPMAAGCTFEFKGTGTWTESGDMVTSIIQSATNAVIGCTDPSKDVAAHADTGIDMTPQALTWSVSGSTLTLSRSDGSSTTFMRQ